MRGQRVREGHAKGGLDKGPEKEREWVRKGCKERESKWRTKK